MHTLNLDPFKYSGTNITGIRLVRPLDDEFKKAVSQWTVNLSPLEPDDKIVLPENIGVCLTTRNFSNIIIYKNMHLRWSLL